MAVTLNDIIRLRTLSNVRNGVSRIVNVFNYNVHSGELPDDNTTWAAIFLAFKDAVLEPWFGQLSQAVLLENVAAWKVWPTRGVTRIKSYLSLGLGGAFDESGEDFQWDYVAACINFKSFIPKRKGYGRKYLGPLPVRFIGSAGNLIVDPVGVGDLGEVLTAVQAPITVTVGAASIEMRPVIVPAVPTESNFSHELREASFSPNVSTLKTRKPGRGM